MIEIGTKAIISVNGKPLLATHWDGHPISLGLGLVRCNLLLSDVLDLAMGHAIDAAIDSIRPVILKRYGLIPRISSMDCYTDSAEYQYDIRGGKVFYRKLEGCFPESLRSATWFSLLTERRVMCDSY